MLPKLTEDSATTIQWDTPISQLLPGDFALPDKWVGDQITVEDDIYHKVDWMPVEEVSGAGAVITNVLDYAKWVRALLRPQTLVEKDIFRSLETVHQLWQPRTLMPTEAPFTGRAYALGWRTGYYLGIQIYEHSGGMNAFGTQLLLVPELQFCVSILANTAQTSNYAAQLLAFYLLDERLGIPGEQRFDWDRRNWSLVEQEKQRVADKVKYRPPIVLPLTLPLDEYAGTYAHAGYNDITVYFSKGILHADRKDMTWPETIRFQHVTGEHFLMLSTHNEDFGAFCPEVYDAEFRISIQGKPWTLGIAWERAMGGEKILPLSKLKVQHSIMLPDKLDSKFVSHLQVFRVQYNRV
ncbi:beta-lactamase/transpeptidase-like protein [Penicillium viridicatum]|nr:beta-lactamase/transpeptidase-like protein [Penicillium viridicatum]